MPSPFCFPDMMTSGVFITFIRSGQARHGRADRSILLSLCGSPQKIQNRARIIFRSLLVRVVAASGEDSQLAPWKVAVKSSGLFHVKDRAAVRIEHQRWAAYRRQDGPQI